ncbi:MAG: hypothetical protein WA459_11450 [Stellaceae bacterium]
MAPMAGKQRHKRMMRHHVMAKRGAGDAATDQLNREELARIQGGPPPGMPPKSSATPYVKGQ